MMGIMETLNAHSPGKRPPDFALTVRRECDRMVPRIDTIADHDEAEAFSKSPFYYGCGLGAAATLVSLKKPINSLERYCPSGLK